MYVACSGVGIGGEGTPVAPVQASSGVEWDVVARNALPTHGGTSRTLCAGSDRLEVRVTKSLTFLCSPAIKIRCFGDRCCKTWGAVFPSNTAVTMESNMKSVVMSSGDVWPSRCLGNTRKYRWSPASLIPKCCQTGLIFVSQVPPMTSSATETAVRVLRNVYVTEVLTGCSSPRHGSNRWTRACLAPSSRTHKRELGSWRGCETVTFRRSASVPSFGDLESTNASGSRQGLTRSNIDIRCSPVPTRCQSRPHFLALAGRVVNRPHDAARWTLCASETKTEP